MEGKLRSVRCTHLESKQTSCCNLLLHLTTYGLFPLLVAWSPYINPLLATWGWKLLNFGRWVPPFCKHFWLGSRIMWESHMHFKMCTWWPTCSMKSVVLRFSDICGWPSVSFDSLPVSRTVLLFLVSCMLLTSTEFWSPMWIDFRRLEINSSFILILFASYSLLLLFNHTTYNFNL